MEDRYDKEGFRISSYHHAYELPKGIVVPLFPRNGSLFAIRNRHPSICLKCGALANSHCRTDPASSIWSCIFCAAENAGRFDARDFGGTAKPREYLYEDLEYRNTIPAGGAGGAGVPIAASQVAVEPPGLILVLDCNLPGPEDTVCLMDALGQLLSNPKLDPMTPVSILVFGKTVSIYRVGLCGGEDIVAECVDPDVIEGCAGLQKSELEAITSAFQKGEYSIPLHAGKSHLLSILKSLVSSSALRYPSSAPSSQPDGSRKVNRCLGGAIDSLVQCYPKKRARVLVFTTGCPQALCDVAGEQNKGQAAAVHQSTIQDHARERQLYFGELSHAARAHGLAIDIFCLGLAAHLDSASLYALVSHTGGSLLLYPSAREPELPLDLASIIANQLLPPHPSLATTIELRVSSHMEITTVLRGLDEEVEDEGKKGGWFISSPSSPPLIPGPCGPEYSLEEGWTILHAKEEAKGKSLTPRRLPYWAGLKRVTLPRLCLRASSMDLVLLFRQRDSIFGIIWNGTPPDSFHFQCILRYIDEDGKTIVTRSLTEQIHSKMTTRDHEAMAVLAVKRAMSQILHSTALEEARSSIDLVVEEIRKLYPSQKQFTRSKDGFGKPCGTEFVRALELLYQAKRGPLLGHSMQGDDLRPSIHYRFLGMGMKDALRFMAPIMLSSGPLGDPANSTSQEETPSIPLSHSTAAIASAHRRSSSKAVSAQPQSSSSAEEKRLHRWPCQSMCLWPNVIILLDTQERLLIWIGREVVDTLDSTDEPTSSSKAEAEKVLNACRTYANKARQERFPVPPVLEIMEGDPLERFVLARVVPSHKDPPEILNESFPDIRRLDVEKVEELRLRFTSLNTDDLSLDQYVKYASPIPAPPSTK